MKEEKMTTYGFALYPSTKELMDEYKKEEQVTWDEMFKDLIEFKKKEVKPWDS